MQPMIAIGHGRRAQGGVGSDTRLEVRSTPRWHSLAASAADDLLEEAASGQSRFTLLFLLLLPLHAAFLLLVVVLLTLILAFRAYALPM